MGKCLTLKNRLIMSNLPSLEKGSKKYFCPSCEKKSFVYYRTVDNNLIDETVGRCDRVDNCGYHLPPKEWYKLHPTTLDNSNCTNYQSKPIATIKQPLKRSIDYVPIKYILDSAKTRNSNFVYFLLDFFDWDSICEIADSYFLGCTKDRAVIYPMIDENGKCRTAKIQQYDKANGKRLKGTLNGINWVHAILKKRGVLSNDFNLSLCLFGMHLIRSERNNDKTVCICESEKSAIIAALLLPQYIWMASGALEWLNVNKLKPLKGRTVLLFPDTSKTNYAFDKWNSIASQAKEIGVAVNVSDLLENLCTQDDKEKGYDIGDMLISSLHKPKANQTVTKAEPKEKDNNLIINDLCKVNPAFEMLVNTFDLLFLSKNLINANQL